MQNFVIINPDQWRADYSGCYGHPLVRTPHLDRLAAEGTRFDQCHVQHTVCSPSRCSFMTGWYPHVRGHRNLTHLLRPDEPNLLKTLKANGYEVAWFGKNDLLAQESFEASVDYFDNFWENYERAGNRFASPQEPGYYSFLYNVMPGSMEEHGDTRKVMRGIRFLERSHDKPFCLYLPLGTPHPPFTAPEPYYSLYSPDEVGERRPAGLPGKPRFYQRLHEFYGLDRTEPRVFCQLNAVYLGMISLVDALIGRVLDALDQLGLADSTTVLVHSDHGEWAGDYGLVEKWSSGLDDCLTRVPLVVRTPGGVAGHVVREPVELFDQMATILNLAGIDADHTHFARSLVPQLHGAAGDPERAVFAEGGHGTHERHSRESYARTLSPDEIYYGKITAQAREPELDVRATMMRTATHKLTVRPETGEHELYDLVADPQELANVYGQEAYASVQASLKERLLEWYVRTSDVTPRETDPRGLPPQARYWRGG